MTARNRQMAVFCLGLADVLALLLLVQHGAHWAWLLAPGAALGACQVYLLTSGRP
jgi:hypothetical protein